MIINIGMLLIFISRWLAASSLLTHAVKAKLQQELRLDANNEFYIAIFSDLHYGEEEDGWGITQDLNSTRVMNDILDYEDPDFVIISPLALNYLGQH
jgi:hypothetical protein